MNMICDIPDSLEARSLYNIAFICDKKTQVEFFLMTKLYTNLSQQSNGHMGHQAACFAQFELFTNKKKSS